MSANVRCTNVNAWKDGAPRICGWKGERLGWVSAYMYPTETMAQLEQRVSTVKRCPKCGGEVEIIPRPAP